MSLSRVLEAPQFLFDRASYTRFSVSLRGAMVSRLSWAFRFSPGGWRFAGRAGGYGWAKDGREGMVSAGETQGKRNSRKVRPKPITREEKTRPVPTEPPCLRGVKPGLQKAAPFYGTVCGVTLQYPCAAFTWNPVWEGGSDCRLGDRKAIRKGQLEE